MRPSHLVVLALLIAGPASAALPPGGMNLRWDQCYADGGVANKTFACDTNTGSERLVMSLELTSEMPQVTGFSFSIAIASASPTLPAWWAFKNTGTCRQTALNYDPVYAGVQCPDWSNGSAVGGIGAYNVGYGGPSTVLLRGAAGAPLSVDLMPGVEYAMGSLVISHAKTVGTGTCGGCATPVCIVFSDMYISTPASPTGLLLYNGANWAGSVIASWQNSYIAAMFPSGYSPEGIFYVADITNCVPYSTTAARPRTWGAVKALYR